MDYVSFREGSGPGMYTEHSHVDFPDLLGLKNPFLDFGQGIFAGSKIGGVIIDRSCETETFTC